MSFSKLNDTPIAGLSYEDTDVEDGIYCSHKLAAVGNAESDYSDAVRQMHGPRNGFYMFQVDAGEIPMGNNYLDGGPPEIVGGAGTVAFEPALDGPPADC